jgi:alpha-D-ribose 1-methylphosphonate 5-triphosphate diphosphatase
MLDSAPQQSRRIARISSTAIVLADRVVQGTITIENGVIAEIEEGVIDPRHFKPNATHLLPGLVELHTDHLEPHYAPRPNVLWDPLAAVLAYDAQIAASGITTVFDCLRAGCDEGRDSVASGLFVLGDAIKSARDSGLLRVDHLLHLRCEISSERVLLDAEQFLDRHDVHLMSLMDHTPGQRQYRDIEKLRAYYRGKGKWTHEQVETLLQTRLEERARNHDRHRQRLVDLAQGRHVALASHDDTTIEHVRESQDVGVSIAEFPTTIEAAEACQKLGIKILMGAPNVVRGGSHSGNVSARTLAELGLLDALSSDYIPASLLQGALQLADLPAIGGLPGAIRLVSKTPADAVGLRDRGEIAVGKRADLVLATLDGRVPVVREVIKDGQRVL